MPPQGQQGDRGADSDLGTPSRQVLRTAIYEAVAETSDEMFEKYFSGEQFTPEELIVGVSQGVKSGSLCPVFCGDAQTTDGVDQLMNGLIWLAPRPQITAARQAWTRKATWWSWRSTRTRRLPPSSSRPSPIPFVGKLSYFKVISGKISPETQLINMRTGNPERIGKMVVIRGKKQEDMAYIGAGDIGAAPKLQNTNTGDTLCPRAQGDARGRDLSAPSLSMAILPKNKGDEDKVA